MTGSPLQRFLITPAVISTAVFGVLTLPLAIFGDQPVTIQLQDEPIFHGELRDPNVAMPYLGLVAVLGLTAGASSIAITGWRQSARKSAQTEAQLSSLEQNLKERDELLESLKAEESRLTASGLTSFLDEELQTGVQASPEEQPAQSESEPAPEQSQPEPALSLPQVTQPAPAPTPQPEVKPAPAPSSPPFVINTSLATTPSESSTPATVQSAAAKFASAQSYMAYASKKAPSEPQNVTPALTSSDLEKLQGQFQQIKEQMEFLNKAIQAQEHTPDSSGTAHPTQLRVIKNWSVEKIS
ncbi:MAG: hypothetical protein RIB93_26005 [Coleofasciculus sp. D1-CHI-01]|uniref:hypothetical protein n=1 Tax=Coleofasciculus sp. D1-CHI-01 TaxID=3068482 RepID=UPI0032F8C745